jgi:hypothetical protein
MAFRLSVRAVVIASALAVLAFAAWSPGLPGPYQFDDYATPLNDPASHSLAAWAKHLSVTLRPVTKLTYALEAEAGLDGSPAARRAVSIVLQSIAAGLLFLFIARLEPGVAPLGAALAAAVWVVHPVHAESVLAVSGRTALLAGVFLLAALIALEARKSVLAGLLFVLACLSRETALAGALPLIVLAVSRPGETWQARLRASSPILVAGAAALTWCLTTPRYLDLAEYSFLGRPVLKSFYAQVGAVPAGLGLLARPSGLSIDYGVPLPTRWSDPLFLLGVLLYAVVAVAIVLLVRRSRVAAIGLALWLAALLPTQSVIPKLDPLTNRPLGLALAGLLIALVPVLAVATRRVDAPVLVAAAGVVVAILGASAGQRAALYRSELALWGDAASKSRANARPHLLYATLLKQEGRDQDAWRAVSAARAIDPFSSGIAAVWRTYRPSGGEP